MTEAKHNIYINFYSSVTEIYMNIAKN